MSSKVVSFKHEEGSKKRRNYWYKNRADAGYKTNFNITNILFL